MKPIIILCAFPFLLTGCASAAYMESVTETTVITEPCTTDSYTPELTFETFENGVSFSLDGMLLQTIPAEHPPDAEDIFICDYNSDGFPDVFLPDFPHSLRGHYYRYDNISGQLVLWDVLNFEEGGTGWYMEKEPDGTLLMTSDSIYGTTITRYQWEQGALVPVQLTEHYWVHGGSVADIYEYSADGQKILRQREITDEDGSQTEIIENPLYFRITPDAVLVLKGTKTVQELAAGGFWDGYAELEAYFEQQKLAPTVPLEGAYLREPEQYLGTEDYDFDGHADLYVPDAMHKNRRGTYYRFLPETGQYVLWDALNAIGSYMYTEPENRTLNAFVGEEGQRHLQSWQWQDGVLIMAEAS